MVMDLGLFFRVVVVRVPWRRCQPVFWRSTWFSLIVALCITASTVVEAWCITLNSVLVVEASCITCQQGSGQDFY
jgi:hypothetical protein